MIRRQALSDKTSHALLLILYITIAALVLAVTPAASLGQEEDAVEGEIVGNAAVGGTTDGGAMMIIYMISTPWLDTGLEVQEGDMVTIQALASDILPPCAGAEGCPPYIDPDDVMAEGAVAKGFRAFVAKIAGGADDQEAQVMDIGRGLSFLAAKSGTLFIGFNDCEGCFSDNTGAFEVTIGVEPGEGAVEEVDD
ncbi:MAG: hypothetical protein JW885_16905 [Deltaproteobacteria bacterium]|nr:hypothetical protein [Candidatus Zymogenaceae bacterium]